MNVKQIDLKHHIELECHGPDAEAIELLVQQNGIKTTIRKTSNNTDIPDDEPVMIFRARDRLAIPLLLQYLDLCKKDNCVVEHKDGIVNMIRLFENYKKTHAENMKQPGITRGL